MTKPWVIHRMWLKYLEDDTWGYHAWRVEHTSAPPNCTSGRAGESFKAEVDARAYLASHQAEWPGDWVLVA